MDNERIGTQVFGSWRIAEKIGEGSFGKVYRLERNDFGVIYNAALKVITIPQTTGEIKSLLLEGMDEKSVAEYFAGFVGEIVNEIALMAKLKGNSNIVSYEDHQVIAHNDKIGWDILIRMEYLTPVLEHYQRSNIRRNDIIKLGIDMCSALELCQRYNIVHRDIKPENIFISPNGDYKLGDFGIARTIEKTVGGLSKKGTYTYMAPEVYKGEEYGTGIDIYSLGIVLYRFLNDNKTPFLPLGTKTVSYRERETALAKRMSGTPLPRPVNATDRLAEIILKACAYDPNMRYSSPKQMREDLMAVYYGKGDSTAIFLGGDRIDVHKSAFTGNGKGSSVTAQQDKQPEQGSKPDKTLSMYKAPIVGSDGTATVYDLHASAEQPKGATAVSKDCQGSDTAVEIETGQVKVQNTAEFAAVETSAESLSATVLPDTEALQHEKTVAAFNNLQPGADKTEGTGNFYAGQQAQETPYNQPPTRYQPKAAGKNGSKKAFIIVGAAVGVIIVTLLAIFVFPRLFGSTNTDETTLELELSTQDASEETTEEKATESTTEETTEEPEPETTEPSKVPTTEAAVTTSKAAWATTKPTSMAATQSTTEPITRSTTQPATQPTTAAQTTAQTTSPVPWTEKNNGDVPWTE